MCLYVHIFNTHQQLLQMEEITLNHVTASMIRYGSAL